jgi:hypothetical protein
VPASAASVATMVASLPTLFFIYFWPLSDPRFLRETNPGSQPCRGQRVGQGKSVALVKVPEQAPARSGDH